MTLDLDAEFPVALLTLGKSYRELGHHEPATVAHQKLAHTLSGKINLAQIYAWAGQPDVALEIARSYEQMPDNAYPLAQIHAALGDADQAVYRVEKMRDEGSAMYLGVFGWFTATRPLHNDPRIQALAEEAGLPLIPYPKD